MITEIEINGKIAETEFAVTESIKNRWSPRSFTGTPLAKETVLTILEAASRAPSAMNEQPWRFYYALNGTAGFASVYEGIMAGNKPWTGKAGALLVVTAKKLYERNGNVNKYHFHDTGIATGFLLVQAQSMNVYAHILGGFNPEVLRSTFSFPADEEIVTVIALGYKDSPEKLDEPFRTRELTPQKRRALSKTVADVAALLPKEKNILVIGRHPDIMTRVLALINNSAGLYAEGALTDEEAQNLFKLKKYNLVIFGGGVSEASVASLTDYFTAATPGIKIIQHFGGGSGLLFNEIEEAMSRN